MSVPPYCGTMSGTCLVRPLAALAATSEFAGISAHFPALSRIVLLIPLVCTEFVRYCSGKCGTRWGM